MRYILRVCQTRVRDQGCSNAAGWLRDHRLEHRMKMRRNSLWLAVGGDFRASPPRAGAAASCGLGSLILLLLMMHAARNEIHHAIGNSRLIYCDSTSSGTCSVAFKKDIMLLRLRADARAAPPSAGCKPLSRQCVLTAATAVPGCNVLAIAGVTCGSSMRAIGVSTATQ